MFTLNQTQIAKTDFFTGNPLLGAELKVEKAIS